jgi:predicted N-acetyltransferase YhbS
LTIEQATEADFDRIQAVREECSWEQTQAGTSYLKRLQPDELESMLPVSLVMRINGNIAGTIYVEEVRSHPGVASIGGFAVAKKYRKFRLSETLLKSAITKAAQDGYEKAISITASQKVKELFRLAGGMEGAEEYIDVFVKALRRYVIAERDLVSLFEFDLQS